MRLRAIAFVLPALLAVACEGLGHTLLPIRGYALASVNGAPLPYALPGSAGTIQSGELTLDPNDGTFTLVALSRIDGTYKVNGTTLTLLVPFGAGSIEGGSGILSTGTFAGDSATVDIAGLTTLHYVFRR